jgi:hypothetical protein
MSLQKPCKPRHTNEHDGGDAMAFVTR